MKQTIQIRSFAGALHNGHRASVQVVELGSSPPRVLKRLSSTRKDVGEVRALATHWVQQQGFRLRDKEPYTEWSTWIRDVG